MSDLSTTVHKRSRRTQDAVQQLEAQIIEVLTADHPQSVRHVFYRMTDPRLPEPVEKSEKGYRQVQNRISLMREQGRLPYGWITDATRRGYHVDTFTGASDFIDRMSGLYRADAWRTSEHYVEVWTESRSIAGIIEDDCEQLGVSLYPAGGFTSKTLAFDAAGAINRACAGGRAAQIIYIGDYDPAGVLIDKSIEGELRKHLKPTVHLLFHRIAINPDQIALFSLPTKPRKTTDLRSLHIAETVEAEAMPAAVLRRLLRKSVEQFMPAGALQAAEAAEESERKFLRSLADQLAGDRR